MKKQRVVRTNPEKLAEILYDAIKRYIHSKNEKKQLDFQPCKSGNGHRFRDMGKENHDEKNTGFIILVNFCPYLLNINCDNIT